METQSSIPVHETPAAADTSVSVSELPSELVVMVLGASLDRELSKLLSDVFPEISMFDTGSRLHQAVFSWQHQIHDRMVLVMRFLGCPAAASYRSVVMQLAGVSHSIAQETLTTLTQHISQADAVIEKRKTDVDNLRKAKRAYVEMATQNGRRLTDEDGENFKHLKRLAAADVMLTDAYAARFVVRYCHVFVSRLVRDRLMVPTGNAWIDHEVDGLTDRLSIHG